MRSSPLLWGTAFLAAGAGGLCAAVVLAGLWLSSPAPAIVGPPPPELVGAEAVAFPSRSGTTLHGWWVPAANGGVGTVVLMHGVRGNRLQMLSRAKMLCRNGFSVLLFDFQAHGESPGRRITFGKLEGLDAAAAVQYARGRQPGNRIGVIGTSLGGAAALLGPEPLAVNALVLEAVYPNIDAALANRLRVNLGSVAGPLITPALARLFKVFLPSLIGVAPDDLRPIDRIATAGVPVLIASGTADTYTPLSEAHSLFTRAAEPKQFWAVEGAGHVDFESYNAAQYWSVVLAFLVKDWPATP